MDKVLTREEAAAHIKMSPRNLNRFMAARLVPFIKTHFSKNPAKGRVYFSQKKLDIWKERDEDFQAMSEAEKEAWKIEQNANIVAERGKEADEELLALEILKLSKTLLSCLDEGKNPSLSEKEREKLEEHSEDFSEYFAKIPELHSLEKKRLIEFFDEDMDCLFHYFPKTFEVERKARKEAEAKQVGVVEMYGGVPLERFPTLPGTKKEKKQSIQVTIEQADEVKK